jgi:HK97 family phage major capsid protein
MAAKLDATQRAFFAKAKRDNDAHRPEIDATKVRGAIGTAVRATLRNVAEAENAPTLAEQRYAKAVDTYLRSGRVTAELERRANTETSGPVGGYAVPAHMYQELLKDVKAASPIVGHATLVETPDSGGPLNYPMLIDAGNVASQTAQDTQGTETDVVMGNVAFGNCPTYLSPNLARVSFALMQDTTFDLNAVLREAWALRVAKGLEMNAVATIIAACNPSPVTSAGPIDWHSLMTAYFAIDAGYRAGAIWVFTTTAMKDLMNASDTNGRPLLVNAPFVTDTDNFGVVTLAPTLMGCRLFESNAGFDNVSTTQTNGAGKHYGFFGNVSKVLPVRSAGATIQMLPSRYADYAQAGFVGRARFDASQTGITAAGVVISTHA